MDFKVVIVPLLLLVLSSTVEAHLCGKVKGQKIVTYGELSCAEAKRVYKAFQAGHAPADWNCGLSAGECGNGSKGFTFRFN